MKKSISYGEMLRHENEITKLKLQAEFGMQMNGSGELNPEIENIWLNQILKFERMIASGKKITISELLGSPVFKPVAELMEDEIPERLHDMMNLLKTKNIVVESLDGVNDKELYRFITEELLLEETESELPENMISCFIYEEYHPDDDREIKKQAECFINLLLEKKNSFFEELLAHHMGEEEAEIAIDDLKRKLYLFREAFDVIRIDEFEISDIKVSVEKGEVMFRYQISVLPPHSSNFQQISGNGKFYFIKDLDYWFIEKIVMKGVV